MTAKDYLLASHWQNSLQKLLQFISRQQKDLAEYEQKPEANKKAVAIRHQGIDIMEDFIDDTENLIKLQRDMLEANNILQHKHQTLLHDHRVLRNYAASKGLDLSLLPYMTLKDR